MPVGEIRMVAFDFAPPGFVPCDGRMLDVNRDRALFDAIGKQYGGDGRTTFAVPDLRDRAAVHHGNGVARGATGSLAMDRFAGDKDSAGSIHLNFLITAVDPQWPDPVLGEIRLFAGTAHGQGYELCDGRQLSVMSNTALYSLLGDKFARDGERDYNLFRFPLLTGRTASHGPADRGKIRGKGDYRKDTGKVTHLAMSYFICAKGGMYPQRPD
ncbi:MAG TPA: tail fiber protein [Thermoanaerobaculia bacterium]